MRLYSVILVIWFAFIGYKPYRWHASNQIHKKGLESRSSYRI